MKVTIPWGIAGDEAVNLTEEDGLLSGKEPGADASLGKRERRFFLSHGLTINNMNGTAVSRSRCLIPLGKLSHHRG